MNEFDSDLKKMLSQLTLGDFGTTIIYAAAIHVLMTHTVRVTDYRLFLVVGVILFIIIDWLSRTWIPVTFSPDEDKRNRKLVSIQISKAFLEVIGVCFLVVACVQVLAPESMTLRVVVFNVRNAFAIFLLTSFAWNLLMIRVMKKLNWWELFWAAIYGSAYDMPAANEYTKGLKNRIKGAEDNMKQSGSLSDKKNHILKLTQYSLLESSIRVVSQMLAHHLTWVNLAMALALLISEYGPFKILSGFSLSWIERLGNPLPRVIIALIIILASVVLYMIGRWSNSKRYGILAAAAISVALIIFYTAFQMDDLMPLMIVQQGVFSLFLLYSTIGNNFAGITTAQDKRLPIQEAEPKL